MSLTKEFDPNGDVTIVVPVQQAKKQDALDRLFPPPEWKRSQQDTPEARFRVSSKHLTLTSAYFKGRLGPNWPEGKALTETGSIELILSDCDPEALCIILSIIHGYSRQVPRSVSFDLLVKLALATIYLQCHGAVEWFGTIWIDGQDLPAPPVVASVLNPWIMVAWAFSHDSAFQEVTKLAEQHMIGFFLGGGLPIPKSIIETIHKERESYLGKLFELLNNRFTQLQKGPEVCCFDCDAIHLGILMKCNATSFPRLIFDARPPFLGYSPSSVRGELASWTTRALTPCPNRMPNCPNMGKILGQDIAAHLVTMETKLSGIRLVTKPA